MNLKHNLDRTSNSSGINRHQNNLAGVFDYLAITSSDVVLYPTKIWPKQFFLSSGDRPYNSLVGSTKSSGWGWDMKQRQSMLMKDYLFMSIDMIPKFITQYHQHYQNSNPASTRISIADISNTPDGIDQVISNLVASFSSTANLNYYPISDDAVHNINPNNKNQRVDGKRHTYDYLIHVKIWDEYKDTFVAYHDPKEEHVVRSNNKINQTIGTCHYGPRILLGIFTMESNKEFARRQAVRDTYLNYFKKNLKKRNDGNGGGKQDQQQQRNRICSLKELINSMGTNIFNGQGGESSLLLQDECQLAYVFVMGGGNPNGPNELVDYNGSYPMVVEAPPPHSRPATAHSLQVNETDIIYLNIKENMKEGKSQTFFKYATSIVDEYLYFDYIAKTDSDTLLLPEHLLDKDMNVLPKFPHNVRIYGGSPRGKKEYEQLLGPVYNQGLFYYMSIDLARHITSTNCFRDRIKVWSEDKSVGNFVHSYPLPIRRMRIDSKSFYHPLKDPLVEYRKKWEECVMNNEQTLLKLDSI